LTELSSLSRHAWALIGGSRGEKWGVMIEQCGGEKGGETSSIPISKNRKFNNNNFHNFAKYQNKLFPHNFPKSYNKK
jgi:hypothetical protein